MFWILRSAFCTQGAATASLRRPGFKIQRLARRLPSLALALALAVALALALALALAIERELEARLLPRPP